METRQNGSVETAPALCYDSTVNEEARQIVDRMGLQPLPIEGGYFARTWTGRPAGPGMRETGSAILFLITPEDRSSLHRIQTDEIWHFYSGDPVEHIQLDPGDGSARRTLLGSALIAGHFPQLVVHGGVWQAARTWRASRGWSLLGCTLAPAWDDGEFELADPLALAREFPAWSRWLEDMKPLPPD
jgi:hypothetical protein